MNLPTIQMNPFSPNASVSREIEISIRESEATETAIEVVSRQMSDGIVNIAGQPFGSVMHM